MTLVSRRILPAVTGIDVCAVVFVAPLFSTSVVSSASVVGGAVAL
jgi:hypothetical protein